MSRMLHKALLIEKEGNLNSKAEFRSNRLTRLVVEAAPWEEKRAAKLKSKEDNAENAERACQKEKARFERKQRP